MRSAESSDLLSPAAEAFAEFLARVGDGEEVDFDAFCSERPEIEPELRRLHANWRAFRGAVSGLSSAGAASDSSPLASTESSASALLETLREDSRPHRYEKKDQIARGGMGVIYKVWDRDLRRNLAMKVLVGRSALGKVEPRSLSRFLEEAQITGQLEHPGILPVYELGLDAEGRVYFTMPLVRGENLQRIIERTRSGDGDWTLTRALGVVVRVCEAMGYAHSKGVVHRDLKPANVMVGAFGEAYVMDWGLARVLGEEDRKGIRVVPEAADVSTEVQTLRRETADATPDSALATMDGDIVGTPVYMSPEQAHGWVEQVGPQADVYAIGAMLYHLLTGHRPYLSPAEEDSALAVLRAVKSRPPRPIHELAPEVPAELEAICEKAMAREPKARYASTMELAADLRAFLDMRVVRAYETGAVAKTRKWVQRNKRLAAAIAVAATALVAGLVVSVALYLDSSRNEEDAIAQRNRADANATRLAKELRARTIQQARLFGRTGDFANAEDLLWREHLQDPDDPDSYWALWELYAQNPSLETVRAHEIPGSSRMRDMAIAADGSFLVTCADDRAIRVWDSVSHRLVAQLTGHEGQLWGVGVHPDGRLLASASLDGTVGLWDLVAKRRIRSLAAGEAPPTCATFDPSGGILAAGYRDGSVRLWDPATGECRATLEASTDLVWSLAWHPEQDLLAAAGGDGTVSVWRGSEREAALAHRDHAVAVAFSPDGNMLATGGRDGAIFLWDVPTWELLHTLHPENGSIRRLRFAPDGRSLACAGWYRIDLWDLEQLAIERSFPLSAGAWGVAFLPDGRTIAGALENGDLRFWSLSQEEAVLRLERHAGLVVGDFAPDGRLLLTGDATGRVQKWELPSGRLLETWNTSRSPVRALRIDPGATWVAVGAGREVQVLELASGALVQRFEGFRAETASALDFGTDDTLVLAEEDGSFQVRALPGGELLAELGARGNEAISVRRAPDGSSILTVNRHQLVRSWSVGGDLLAEMDGAAESPWVTTFDPEGRRIAIGSWQRWIEIWDAGLTRRERLLKGHKGVVWDVDWSPVDASLVASCAGDGSARLWDVRTGRCLLKIDAYAGGNARGLRFAPDGRSLLVSDADGAVALWDLSYFDRHIAGNLRYQLDRLEPELSDDVDRAALEAWADEVLARPWPRLGPPD